MFTIIIEDTENKDQNNKVSSLYFIITASYENHSVNLDHTETFNPPKDSITIQEKNEIIGTFFKNNLNTLVNNLKSEANVSDLGQMKVIIM